MFNQTFVDGTQKSTKPVTVAFSIAMQIGALSIFILIPLVYTQGLPSAQLRNFLVAPSPPPVPIHAVQPVQKAQSKQVFRQLDTKALIAPVTIPKRINTIQEAAMPPDTGVIGSAGDQANSSNIPFDVIGSVPDTPPAPKPETKSKSPNAPIRVGSISEANLIHRVQPLYPALARSARVQGTVEFTAIISKEGSIEHLQLVRGHPLLVSAAREAVLQWRYRPTLLNGQPVEVITDIIVNFSLNQ